MLDQLGHRIESRIQDDASDSGVVPLLAAKIGSDASSERLSVDVDLLEVDLVVQTEYLVHDGICVSHQACHRRMAWRLGVASVAERNHVAIALLDVVFEERKSLAYCACILVEKDYRR